MLFQLELIESYMFLFLNLFYIYNKIDIYIYQSIYKLKYILQTYAL